MILHLLITPFFFFFFNLFLFLHLFFEVESKRAKGCFLPELSLYRWTQNSSGPRENLLIALLRQVSLQTMARKDDHGDCFSSRKARGKGNS